MGHITKCTISHCVYLLLDDQYHGHRQLQPHVHIYWGLLGGIFCEPTNSLEGSPTWTICWAKQILIYKRFKFLHFTWATPSFSTMMSVKFSVLLAVGKLFKKRVSNALEESWHQRLSLFYEVSMIREIPMVFPHHVTSLIFNFNRVTIIICLTSFFLVGGCSWGAGRGRYCTNLIQWNPHK